MHNASKFLSLLPREKQSGKKPSKECRKLAVKTLTKLLCAFEIRAPSNTLQIPSVFTSFHYYYYQRYYAVICSELDFPTCKHNIPMNSE